MTEKTKLKAREVAELLGVHVNSVKRLSPEELPYYRFNTRGDRIYDRQDVERFIRQRIAR